MLSSFIEFHSLETYYVSLILNVKEIPVNFKSSYCLPNKKCSPAKEDGSPPSKVLSNFSPARLASSLRKIHFYYIAVSLYFIFWHLL